MSAPPPDALADTSLAVALVLADHDGHDQAIAATSGQMLGLAGHAQFETYSVLTRLPPPARLTPAAAERAIKANFPASRFPSTKAVAELIGELARNGIAGGATYDALVGSTAREHGVTLLTRDARAAEIYRRLGVRYELV